ncbi:DUF4143 domain-containing protein [Nesterenkonia alkaliphila]|uniref:DUF4143 domain-containing protein n=2 Tax=Nesterenkonia alkaliphila TaxID=1463631 RepID=A0A7K1UJL0_9MICC|nr:DUF4143 domain-containing protein [Nesterenkonia alkaliphila]MVT26221.1 DUF4143 domain-containing protein [Nesterenkonia alkaliphila]
MDEILDDLFPHLAAIALEGAKGVGKTATAMQRARTTFSLDDDRQRLSVETHSRQVVEAEPPIFIDEWQLVPAVWDRVRRSVDADPSGGRFLLAGSADIPSGTRIHSGAGRIVSLTMRPLSFAERHPDQGSVSMKDLLSGARADITGTTDFSVPEYAEEILRSGFPGIRDLPSRARRPHLESYVQRIISRDLPENGVLVRKPQSLRKWLEAYAAATATCTSYTKVLAAATAGEDDRPAKETAISYRDHLQRLFILEPLDAWLPSFTPLKRLTQSPKHHLVDPALAAHLAGIDQHGLLRGKGPENLDYAGTWLGALFESLVTQSLRTYADLHEATVLHMRSRGGEHEVDLIIQRPDHSVLGVEVKLSHQVDKTDVKHLHWLETQIGDRLLDKVVINTGPVAYRREDGVAVVPLALLTP